MAGVNDQFGAQIEQSNKLIEQAQQARAGVEGKLDAAYAAETGRQERRLAERDPLIKDFQATIEAPLPPLPKTQDITPFQPKQVSQNEMMNFGALAMGFASLAALGTRAGIAAALTGAAGAMKGYSEGNIAQAKLEMEQHDQTMKTALAQNAKLMADYDAVMKRRDLSLNDKLQMLKVIAVRDKDEAGLGLLKIGNLKEFWDRKSTMIKEQQQMAYQWATFQQRAELAAQQRATTLESARISAAARESGAQSGLSEDAIDNAAAFYILNGRMPIGMARIGRENIEAIQNRAGEMTRKVGMTPEQFAAAGPIVRQKLGALLQLEKTRNAVQAFEGMLDTNISVLKQLSAKVNRSDSPYVNRPIMWLQQNAAGDADVAEYLFQVRTVQTEAARILSQPNLAGQLTDTATQEMANVFGSNLNAEQLNRVAERAQADARNRGRALDKQVDKLVKEVQNPLKPTDSGAALGAPQPPPKGGQTKRMSASGKPMTWNGTQWMYD